MSNSFDDAEIHRIVQSIVQNVMGSSSRESIQPSGKKVVAIGADHGGFELKEALKSDITALGFEVSDMGTNSKDAVDYPDFAHAVAQAVNSGKAWRGIMIDGAGIGSCIVREHNDTNLLTLGAGMIGVALAKQIVKVWLTTEFGRDRHAKRVDKIIAVEKKYLK